jgi:hypothetical protein
MHPFFLRHYPEDGGSKFHRNVDAYLPEKTVSRPTRQYLWYSSIQARKVEEYTKPVWTKINSRTHSSDPRRQISSKSVHQFSVWNMWEGNNDLRTECILLAEVKMNFN